MVGAAESLRSFTRKRGWLGGIGFLVGVGLLTLELGTANTSYRHFAPTADYPNGVVGTLHLGGWRIALIVIAIAMMLFGLLIFSEWSQLRSGSANHRAARVKRLSDALDEALKTIASVRSEVEDGQKILASLQGEIAESSELATLTSDQSKAVNNFLSRALRRERWPSVLLQFVIGLVLICIGVLISHL